MKRIVETDRLYLRQMTWEDFDAISSILQDPEVMYAYEHGFDEEEVREWMDRQMSRNHQDPRGFGLWAVVQKETGEVIGQCGITMQTWGDRQVPEIGYLFAKAYWHQGYALEAARGCRDYFFETYKDDELFSIIRDTNLPSQRVAQRNGMSRRGSFTKHYYHVDMPHLVYSIKREEAKQQLSYFS